jgi:hypothetical protein
VTAGDRAVSFFICLSRREAGFFVDRRLEARVLAMVGEGSAAGAVMVRCSKWDAPGSLGSRRWVGMGWSSCMVQRFIGTSAAARGFPCSMWLVWFPFHVWLPFRREVA